MTKKKPYKYRGPTQIVSMRVAKSVEESGTEIRMKLLEYFKRFATGGRLMKEEIDWCNEVLDP